MRLLPFEKASRVHFSASIRSEGVNNIKIMKPFLHMLALVHMLDRLCLPFMLAFLRSQTIISTATAWELQKHSFAGITRE